VPPARDRTLIRTGGNAGRRLYDIASSRRAVDLMLLALPVTAAYGSLIHVAGPIFGFRVLSLILLVITALKYRSFPLDYRSARIFTLLAFVWLLIGYASTLWSVDKVASFRELFGVTLGLALGIGLLAQSARSGSIARTLIRGWVIAFIATGVIGIYERITGNHLSNYLAGLVPGSPAGRFIASVFGNSNGYAAFLVTAAPFLLWGVMTARSIYSRLFFVANLSTLLVLLLFSGSRICLLALFLQGIVVVIVIASRWYRLAAITGSLLLVAAVLTGGAAALARVFPFLPQKLFSGTESDALAQEFASSSTSGGVRLNLIRDGLWMTGKTHGVGVGAGNFEANMVKAPFPTSHMINPHNLWIEVLSQYGVVVFILLMAWLIFCLVVGIRLLNSRELTALAEAKPLGIIIVVSVLGNLFAAMANSTYLESSTNWVFLGTLAVLTVTAERMLSDHTQSSPIDRPEEDSRLWRFKHRLSS
jgi:teichuronic acid biosynthesis protein TuaE